MLYFSLPRQLLLGCAAFCLLFQYAPSSVSASRSPFHDLRISPTRVALGQPILYRCKVSWPRGSVLLAMPSTHGRARLIQAPTLSFSSTVPPRPATLQLALAIYTVQNYGPQTVPAIKLQARLPNGRIQLLTLPPTVINVRARYTWSAQFKHPRDPLLPFTKKGETRQPSTEWRAAHTHWAPPPSRWKRGWPWLSLMLLLLPLLMFWQRRRQNKKEAKTPAPLHTTLQAWEALFHTAPQTRDEWLVFYTELSRVVRGYLEQRLGLPATALTTTELAEQLQQQWPDCPQQREVVSILTHTDQVRFAMGQHHDVSMMPHLSQQVFLAIQHIDRWKQKHDIEEEEARLREEFSDLLPNHSAPSPPK